MKTENWQKEQDKDFMYLSYDELQGAKKFFNFMRKNGLTTMQPAIIALWATFKFLSGWQEGDGNEL